MPHTRNGNGLAEWPTARGRDQPIVVRVTPETARILGLTLDQLTQAVEGLEVWGLHASGEKVYRCADVLRRSGGPRCRVRRRRSVEAATPTGTGKPLRPADALAPPCTLPRALNGRHRAAT